MGNMFDFAFVLVILLFLQVTALYSFEKKGSSTTFCRAKQFKQMISHPGCQSKIIVNYFCYGQCESTFTPTINNNDSAFTNDAVIKCSACRPTDPYVKEVSLKCDDESIYTRAVAIFRFCQCIHRKCNKISYENLLKINLDNNTPSINTQTITPLPPKINIPKNMSNNESRSTRRRAKCLAKSGEKQQACFKRWRKDKEREKQAAEKSIPSLVEDGTPQTLKQ